MVGFWATLALNIPDLSRYARDQKAQAVGQLLGLPTTMTLFSFIGVAVTSASVIIFGEAIWDPVALLSRLGLRKARLSLADLYRADGLYGRWNPKALIALAAGIAVALIGLVVPALRVLYDYSWFVGFAVAFVIYTALMRGTPVLDLSQVPDER